MKMILINKTKIIFKKIVITIYKLTVMQMNNQNIITIIYKINHKLYKTISPIKEKFLTLSTS